MHTWLSTEFLKIWINFCKALVKWVLVIYGDVTIHKCRFTMWDLGRRCVRNLPKMSQLEKERGRFISMDLHHNLPLPSLTRSREFQVPTASVPKSLYIQVVGKRGANSLAQETIPRSLRSSKMYKIGTKQWYLKFVWHLLCVGTGKYVHSICVLEEPDGEWCFKQLS